MSSDFSFLGQISAYELLDVGPSASEQDIIEAHRKLIQQNHPDRKGSARIAQLINDARRVLTTQRAEYDEWLRRRESPAGATSEPTAEPETPSESFEDPWDQASQYSPFPQPPPRQPQQYPPTVPPDYAPKPPSAQSYPRTQLPYRTPSLPPPVTRRRRRRPSVLRIIFLFVLLLIGISFISNVLSRPSSSPAPSKSATPVTVATTSKNVPRASLTRRAGPVQDRHCAARATGQIATYLKAHGCTLLARSLYTTTQGPTHRGVLIATTFVDFKVSASSKKVVANFTALELTDGTGDLEDLLAQNHRSYAGGPTTFAVNATYYAKPTARKGQVLVMKAMWLKGRTVAHDQTLTSVLKAAAPHVR